MGERRDSVLDGSTEEDVGFICVFKLVTGGLDKVKAILREGREIKEKERLERVMGEAAVVGRARGEAAVHATQFQV